MKNKKGLLLPEETVRIIIAVMVIFLLFTIAFKLYDTTTTQSRTKQAEAHMDKIKNIIGGLERKGGGSETYVLLSPSDWVLTEWPFIWEYEAHPDAPKATFSVEGGAIPQECVDNGWNECFCLCPKGSTTSGKSGFGADAIGVGFDECNEGGFCYGGDFASIDIIDRETRFTDSTNYMYIKNLIKSGKSIKISLKDNKLTIQRNL